MRAIISDIHSNLDALVNVLADIQQLGQGIEIDCLGDIIGYGPEPCACIDLVRANCRIILRGNHDDAVIDLPKAKRFNYAAELSAIWTAEQLKLQPAGGYEAYILSLNPEHRDGTLRYVHGSPLDVMDDYVFPDDVNDPTRMDVLFSLVDDIVFMGHTHIPGVFLENSGVYTFVKQVDVPAGFVIPPGTKAMVNVGSVGQPRDFNPDSCYVLFDEITRAITFRRVGYLVDAVTQKILAIPDLSPFFGERLKIGK